MKMPGSPRVFFIYIEIGGSYKQRQTSPLGGFLALLVRGLPRRLFLVKA